MNQSISFQDQVPGESSAIVVWIEHALRATEIYKTVIILKLTLVKPATFTRLLHQYMVVIRTVPLIDRCIQ